MLLPKLEDKHTLVVYEGVIGWEAISAFSMGTDTNFGAFWTDCSVASSVRRHLQ